MPKLKEQTIARFLRGLWQDITNIMELQPYCSFEDVCKIAIKIKKQRKNIRLSITNTFTKGTSFSNGSSSNAKPKTSSRDKGKEKVVKQHKEKSNSTRTNQNDKKCFKCLNYGHFQSNCPNQRMMTLKEMQAIE